MANMSKVGKTATRIFKYDTGQIRVKYHDTTVFHLVGPDMHVILSTGGWTTPTTRTRINQACAQFGVTGRAFIKNETMYFDRFDGNAPIEITAKGTVIPLY